MDAFNKPVIFLCGPTAVGKTSISIDLAKKLNGEIISADSRQLYKELNIGVAKPNTIELQEIKHHLISEISIKESFTVTDFRKFALRKINEISQGNKFVIVTGGTGLYIKSLLSGLDDIPEVDPSIRKNLNDGLNKHGLEILQDKLKKLDPKSFDTIDILNPRRVIRALEVCLATNKPYSEFIGKSKKEIEFNTINICLMRDRQELYDRINRRVGIMIEEGLENEANSLYPFRKLPALRTVGYSEMFEYFEHKLNFMEAVDRIKINTRRYAKRQITWFKNQGNFEYITISTKQTDSELANKIIQNHNLMNYL